jgi:hypothetical protein
MTCNSISRLLCISSATHKFSKIDLSILITVKQSVLQLSEGRRVESRRCLPEQISGVSCVGHS